MKVGIYTLGCKVNTYESEYVLDLFEKKGYEIGSFDDKCDIYVINTCTVTNQSDSKSRKMINQAIKRNPDACIVAMGCFIEANKDNLVDGVNIYVGNKDKSKIVELVEKYLKEKEDIKKFYTYEELSRSFENMEIDNFEGRTRAFVKIQDGCENFCTYCIIPYVRGKCRSKKPDLVIDEITNLVNKGYKEIVLTGIHTGNYGADLTISFAELLRRIVNIPNLYRLRISSIEITELTDEVLDIIKDNDVIANHLHIPLQAGSDFILKQMNRKYDKAYFKKKIDYIRSLRRDISISTDVIVGFPGETEKHFEETLDFCREIGFSKIHVFPYSVRRNTPASKFPNQLDGSIKKDRARRLIELSKELEIEYMSRFIGTEVEVLMEKTKEEGSFGHTSNFLLIKSGDFSKKDDIIKVGIEKIDYPYCIGKELVKER